MRYARVLEHLLLVDHRRIQLAAAVVAGVADAEIGWSTDYNAAEIMAIATHAALADGTGVGVAAVRDVFHSRGDSGCVQDPRALQRLIAATAAAAEEQHALAAALLDNRIKLVGRSFKYHRPRGLREQDLPGHLLERCQL